VFSIERSNVERAADHESLADVVISFPVGGGDWRC
jgi:hypothetical protein